jgi:hypothetical protein
VEDPQLELLRRYFSFAAVMRGSFSLGRILQGNETCCCPQLNAADMLKRIIRLFVPEKPFGLVVDGQEWPKRYRSFEASCVDSSWLVRRGHRVVATKDGEEIGLIGRGWKFD